MNTHTDYSTDRLADRAQITDALYRYCRAIDRYDCEALRDVYHPDAIDSHGLYIGGLDGLIDWVRERHKSISFSMHIVANILIEFAGADAAVVETYFHCSQHYPAEEGAAAKVPSQGQSKAGVAMDLTGYGRYVDQFTRRNGVWRIQHRSVVTDWNMLTETTAPQPKMAPGCIWGTRDKADCIYETRKIVGLS